MMPPTVLCGEQWFTPLLLNALIVFLLIYQTINIGQFIVSDDNTIVINIQDGHLVFQRTPETFFIVFEIRTMHDYHHLTLCIRSAYLTNVSNQVPQPPQTIHSPYCYPTRSPTPYPSPRNNPKTILCPVIHTHQVSPDVPFEIPCPICQAAIERGECHHHGEIDIVYSVSMNRRADRESFTIHQVLHSPSPSLSYSPTSYTLASFLRNSPPALPIQPPPYIDYCNVHLQQLFSQPCPSSFAFNTRRTYSPMPGP